MNYWPGIFSPKYERLILDREYTDSHSLVDHMDISKACPKCGVDVKVTLHHEEFEKAWVAEWWHGLMGKLTTWTYDEYVETFALSCDEEELDKTRWNMIAENQFWLFAMTGCFTVDSDRSPSPRWAEG